ncbi:UDP-3-O-(3-hydroxymyristoyl)glucosamine N-acyltransferase [Rhodospirillum rubrum]|nr:UDP-3-O-(3-hydroxymyristoyl)glucosamine N-acyltransferase [Rhodospirillum rubrum]MBK1677948.1 UDP-3-O-(3-hydroxymyristoyl)glucosamine N-acyltransferase [Rhodospirillum rubrum]
MPAVCPVLWREAVCRSSAIQMTQPLPMTLTQVAEALGGTLHGQGDLIIRRPVHPARAEAGEGVTDLAVAMEPALLAALDGSAARAALVAGGAVPPAGSVDGWIEVGRPRFAMHVITNRFEQPARLAPGIHPSAVVEEGAEIGEGAALGPFVHVGFGARVGAGSRVHSGVSIGAGAVVGADCLLHPGVRIGERVRVGDRVILHANAVIGADGFSFVTPEPGSVESAKATGRVDAINSRLARIASLGAVVLGDDVEIGANTCIDRGTLDDTRIGDGTKIDDMVMIGHNVRVGRLCMLCAQVGIAGSAVIGDGVVLAGRVGVADHITIGDNAVVGAGSGVGSNIPPRSVWMGYPALPKDQATEHYLFSRRLKHLFKDVSELKKRIRSLTVPS